MYSKDNAFVQTSGRCITQPAKVVIDPKFIELTAGVVRRDLKNIMFSLGRYPVCTEL